MPWHLLNNQAAAAVIAAAMPLNNATDKLPLATMVQLTVFVIDRAIDVFVIDKAIDVF